MIKNVMLLFSAAATMIALTGCAKGSCVKKDPDMCMDDLEKSTCEGSSGKFDDKPCAALGYTVKNGGHSLKPSSSSSK